TVIRNNRLYPARPRRAFFSGSHLSGELRRKIPKMRAEVLALESLEPSPRGNLLRALDTARLAEPIFYSRNLSLLSRPWVAMAGSRGASLWGLTLMGGLGGHLVAEGCCGVRGGAVGTDVAARGRALQCGGETIFILPAPLDELDVN